MTRGVGGKTMRRFAQAASTVLGAACLAGLAAPAAAEMLPADKVAEPPLAALPPAEAAYVRRLHAHLHRRWADNFLRLAGEKLPPINPLNQPGLTAEVDIVIAPDGQLISAQVVKGSGFPASLR